ncbi:MAG TPA: hypothetical protein VMI30_05465 [Stellaceae bacterium]|nr:hypothetical protein [Stellaceae bacterium]
MRAMVALALIVAALTLGGVLTACSNDGVGQDYYENDVHHGYPGPGATDPRSAT